MTFPSIIVDGAGLPVTAGITAGTPALTAIAASGTAHVKGSWVQLEANTPIHTKAVSLYVFTKASNRRFLLDVGVGAAASEQVLLANIGYLTATSTSQWMADHAYFPIEIPAGTRISARVQSATTSAELFVGLLLHQATFMVSLPLQRCVTYGADTGTTTGTSVDPGGTVDTKGSWVELTAACSNRVRQVVVSSVDQNTLPTQASFTLDVGVGGAGSEEVAIEDLYFRRHPTSQYTTKPVYYTPIPVSIPAGSRIAARSKCTINDADDRDIKVILHCMD